MVYFKGSSFIDKGIIVSKTPSISKGARRVEKVTVPGRNGFLTIDSGTYDSFVVSVECHFNSDQVNKDEIMQFLDGYGKFSIDDEREYDAIIINTIKIDKVINSFKEFIVQFECQPIAEDKATIVFNVSETPEELEITEATATMYPIIEITGSGDVGIVINNKAFYLYDMNGKYILDCKEQVITNELGINVADKMLYSFPTLTPGINTITYTGTITDFKISYKKSYL